LLIKLRHKNLIDSEELHSEISPLHLQNLADIFVKHNVQDRLGVHLIHSHSKMTTEHVMLGHHLTNPSGCWTRQTPLKGVNLAEVHGRIFKLVDGNGFVAYEYVEGRATNDLPSIGSNFLEELAAYVRSNGLAEIVGLQVRGQSAGNMVEFDFGNCGTVMLNAQDICHGTPFRTTGWVFSYDGVVSFKGVESHAPTTKGPHKVFIDGKLAPDVPALKAVLRRFNVID